MCPQSWHTLTCLLYTSNKKLHRRLDNMSYIKQTGQITHSVEVICLSSINIITQYQSCFSFRSSALICFISSSVNPKPNKSRFSLIWSGLLDPGITTTPVSYTHLDVYKRQVLLSAPKLSKPKDNSCQTLSVTI